MIAMVLAAGLGTRLRPLTDRIAKPALPLLGSTLLECNLALLARAGIEEVVVNAHHLPETVAHVARTAAERLGLRVHLSIERPTILGTGGALVAARPLLDRGAPFVLLNGDMLSDVDVAAAIAAHEASGADATMVLRAREDDSPFGAVELEESQRVVRIVGYGLEDAHATGSFLFTGLHVLTSRIFEVLPAAGASCVNRQGHAELLRKGAHVHGHVVTGGRWSDVGTKERFRDANLDLLEGRFDAAALGAPLGAAREQRPGIFVHPRARVDPGAELVGPCYVGEAAHLSPGAHVGPRAVVLREGRVDGRLRDGVVAPGAELPAGAEASDVLVC